MRICTSVILVVSTLLTAACGGGDSGGSTSPPKPTPIATTPGIYSGSFTSSTSGTGGDLVGIVTADGQARFFSTTNGGQYFGSVPTTGTTVTGTVTGIAPGGTTWPDLTLSAPFTLTVTAKAQSSLTGSYSGGGDQGTFSFTYQPIYERPSSLAIVAGVYTGTPNGDTTTVAIDANGVVTGSDSYGCVYNGSVTVPNSAANYYDVSVTATTCGPNDGTFTGLATLGDASATSQNNVLIFQINNGNVVITESLTK